MIVLLGFAGRSEAKVPLAVKVGVPLAVSGAWLMSKSVHRCTISSSDHGSENDGVHCEHKPFKGAYMLGMSMFLGGLATTGVGLTVWAVRGAMSADRPSAGIGFTCNVP